MKILWKLLKLITPYRWWMLLAAFLGFLTVGSSIGLLMTSAYIISKAALHPSIAELQVGIVGVRFFGITRGVFRYLERLVSHQTTFRLLAEFRVWFYKKLEPLAPSGLQQHHSGDLQSRIISDIESLENFYQRVLYPPLVAVLITLLTFVLYGQFSFKLACIVFGAMFLTGLVLPFFTVRHTKKIGGEIVTLRAQLTRLSIEYIQGMADLMVFGREKEWRQKIQAAEQQFNRMIHRFTQIETFYQSLVGLLMNATVFALMFAMTPMVASGYVDGVFMAVIALGVMAAFEAISPLPQAAQFWQENKAAANRLFQLAVQPEPQPGQQKKCVQPGISFQNVSFSYHDDHVLENINMNILPGEKVVIVGASGAGKSTIANLLLNFYQPQQGEIFLDGQSIALFSQQQLAEKIIVVPQNPYLFSASIRENLLLRNKAANEIELLSACRQAFLDTVVSALPDDMDTWIGEHGIRLSGGEQQRLALAQGLLANAKYFIFDEPSANLDASLEMHIFEQLFNLPGTVIIITHRLISLERADKIVLMQAGKIVEQGRFTGFDEKSILRQMLKIQNDYVQNNY